MRNASAVLIACLLAAALGAGAVWHFTHRADKLPDPPALVLKVREVARLETLDVSLYKKIDFSPDPQPSGSTWGDVVQWASYSLRPPRGRAIIFADAHLGVDLRKLDVGSLRVSGRKVQAVLPPTRVQVELRPAETEIIGSNLDSTQTAELLQRGRAPGLAPAAIPGLSVIVDALDRASRETARRPGVEGKRRLRRRNVEDDPVPEPAVGRRVGIIHLEHETPRARRRSRPVQFGRRIGAGAAELVVNLWSRNRAARNRLAREREPRGGGNRGMGRGRD